MSLFYHLFEADWFTSSPEYFRRAFHSGHVSHTDIYFSFARFLDEDKWEASGWQICGISMFVFVE